MRDAIVQLADAADVPKDVDRDDLYARTAGHPLSTRYVIQGLLAADTPDSRQEWLRNGPAYGGDVETFYQRAWRELERNDGAREALAFLALAEGPLRPAALDSLVDPAATDAAWRAAQHLLVRDVDGAWSIFHNSFRLFLGAQTGLRFGFEDRGAVLRRYGRLADMARGARSNDPQRWMELRYRARAEDHSAVVALATPRATPELTFQTPQPPLPEPPRVTVWRSSSQVAGSTSPCEMTPSFVWLTFCRSAANAKVDFERTTAARSRGRGPRRRGISPPSSDRAWRSSAATACWTALRRPLRKFTAHRNRRHSG
jgi:hypothetical protein